MDPTTSIITIILSFCIISFGIIALVGSIYGILVWYPAYRKKKVDALKASGNQGEATILRIPDHPLGGYPGRRAVFTMVPIRLEIRVVGLVPYEVEKTFSIPSHALDLLEQGKVVPVWVDPKNPRDLDQIVIDLR